MTAILDRSLVAADCRGASCRLWINRPEPQAHPAADRDQPGERSPDDN